MWTWAPSRAVTPGAVQAVAAGGHTPVSDAAPAFHRFRGPGWDGSVMCLFAWGHTLTPTPNIHSPRPPPRTHPRAPALGLVEPFGSGSGDWLFRTEEGRVVSGASEKGGRGSRASARRGSWEPQAPASQALSSLEQSLRRRTCRLREAAGCQRGWTWGGGGCVVLAEVGQGGGSASFFFFCIRLLLRWWLFCHLWPGWQAPPSSPAGAVWPRGGRGGS